MATSPRQPRRTMDWSLGHYEHTAPQLLPAARVVVDRAAPAEGERMVDVGCGTGNAALLAAALGARVSGVDPAGVIFAPDATAAAAEMARVTAPAGRIVLSAWVPEGAIRSLA